MATKMLIDATHPEETRVVVVDGNKVEEFDFETVNKRQLAGNIYLAKVTRVEPSLQAAFVDYGGNRHGFLAFSEIHPDYYQIPTADRKALLDEERAYARAMEDDEGRERSRRPRPQPRAEDAENGDAVTNREIGNMDVVDLGEDRGADALYDAPSAEAPAAEAPAAAEDHDHAPHDHTNGDSVDETGEERSERRYRALDHAADEGALVAPASAIAVVPVMAVAVAVILGHDRHGRGRRGEEGQDGQAAQQGALHWWSFCDRSLGLYRSGQEARRSAGSGWQIDPMRPAPDAAGSENTHAPPSPMDRIHQYRCRSRRLLGRNHDFARFLKILPLK